MVLSGVQAHFPDGARSPQAGAVPQGIPLPLCLCFWRNTFALMRSLQKARPEGIRVW